MNIGDQITSVRREQQLTQEQFGGMFHVTRQTVSNWENGKSYPDLQTLIAISDRFGVSLDTLLKGDTAMVKVIDRERVLGKVKREQSVLPASSLAPAQVWWLPAFLLRHLQLGRQFSSQDF